MYLTTKRLVNPLGHRSRRRIDSAATVRPSRPFTQSQRVRIRATYRYTTTYQGDLPRKILLQRRHQHGQFSLGSNIYDQTDHLVGLYLSRFRHSMLTRLLRSCLHRPDCVVLDP